VPFASSTVMTLRCVDAALDVDGARARHDVTQPFGVDRLRQQRRRARPSPTAYIRIPSSKAGARPERRVSSHKEAARRRLLPAGRLTDTMSPAITKAGDMCFSATGSFAIAGVLTTVGAAAMAQNSSKPHRMFAAVPLLFAAQQAAEGTVWLTMDGGHPTLNRLAVDIFLAIALVVWPTWLSFSLKLVERNPARRRMLGALFWVGSAVAIYAGVFLARSGPVAEIAGHSIRYDYTASDDGPSSLFYLLVYAIPTVIPFFVSTARGARTIGIMLVVSLIASVVVQRDALTSVWCFFAAILSGLILATITREQHAAQRSRPVSAP